MLDAQLIWHSTWRWGLAQLVSTGVQGALGGAGTEIRLKVLTGRAVYGEPCLAVAGAEGSPGVPHVKAGEQEQRKEKEGSARMTLTLFGHVNICCFLQ